MKLNGSEIIVECLKEQKVDTVFGYPGGTILNVYDALYKHSDEIRHILTSHEQGASHAADGYARSTGKVGVCMATSGPGATNLVTGIATAYMDSVPMVAITCNVNLPALGKDSFQEVDIAGITMPITKHGFIVKDINNLAATIRRAFKIARTGRPGPVLVDITKDVTAAECEYVPMEEDIKPHISDYYAENKHQTFTDADIEKAAQMINESKKPFIITGGGVVISDAADELKVLAKKCDAPVGDTLMGKGGFDGYDDRYTGMVGMHGTKVSNLGVSDCDLLIALGMRFSDRVIGNAATFAKDAKILHIDIDPAEVNKNIRTDASIIGDVRCILKKLNEKIDQKDNVEWMAYIKELKDRYPLKYNEEGLSCPYIMQVLDEVTKGGAIISTDVGQHQMWAAQYYKYTKPRTFISSGGMGTMGYGLGACIGAKVGNPDTVCVNIAGDGCFRMNMNELATASRYNIPIIQVVINNHVLGMVRQWQNLFYGQRYSHTVLEDKVDFCKVAEGLGCHAIKVTSKDEIKGAFEEAIKLNAPCVIECVIPKDDKVFPMVSPGASIATVFDEDDLRKAQN